MRRQRLTAFRKAALGLIACASLLVIADSASAQSDNAATDPVVQGLTNCALGTTTKSLHVLFVLDESGSLRTHDPENMRVEGAVKSLEALKRLADRFRDDFSIDVAIHGFSGGQATTDLPYRDENPWLTFDDFDDLIDDANGFTSRNTGLYTDYRSAIWGAIQAFDKHDPGQRGCRALFWFTDGVYDSENNSALTPSEIAEITGAGGLCEANGLVDQLRQRAITIIAIGLSNESTGNPPDLSLVKAIASGDAVTPENPDLVLPDGRCGTRPGTGDLYQAEDPDELIKIFEGILADALFESAEVRPGDPAAEGGHPPLPCTPAGSMCTFDFFLGPWVEQFTAYFKLPPASGLTASLDPPGDDAAPVDITIPDGPVDGIPGITGESPTRSWRKLTGVADQADGIWTGLWQIRFEGPGAAEAKANIAFVEGTLEIRLDKAVIDRAKPETFETFGLDFKTLACNDTGFPLKLDFTSDIGEISDVSFGPGEKCLIPGKFLFELLTAEGAESASSISFEVKPSLKPVADDAVPLLEFPASSISLKLLNTLIVELAEGSRLDRTDDTTFDAVQLELKGGGEDVNCGDDHLPVILEFNAERGDLAPLKGSAEFSPGELCVVPRGFLQELVATGPGKDALSVTFDVTPSLVADPNFSPLKFPSSTVSIFLHDALVVELADGSRIDRGHPESFAGVGLELFLGNQEFPRDGTQISLDFSANLDGRLVSGSATYGDSDPLVIPRGFLEEALLSGVGRDLLRFTFEVTPEVTADMDGEVGDQPTHGPSAIHIWLHDALEVQQIDQRELDREDRGTYSDVEVVLLLDGQELSDNQARVNLEFATEVGGRTVSSSQSYPPGGPYLIPPRFFDDVFDAAAGTDLLLLSVGATPAVTIDGESHPGYAPSVLQFPVRAGEGFPQILSVTATTMDDGENSTLTVVAIGPNDGTGRVEIRSISGLPDDLQGTIELVEPVSCPAPNKQPVECTTELSASFTANRTVGLEVDLAISGDRTKVLGKSILVSVPITLEMTRPLSTASFISKLLQLLVLFVAVQVLLRALFTTWLAKWEGVEVGSRWGTLRVEVDQVGNVTAVGGGPLVAIDAASTMFANELEGRASSAVIDGITFEISWMRTFLGEPENNPFIRRQRAVIRASSPNEHCIAPEGMDLDSSGRLGTGLVGIQFLRCWVLRLPEGSAQMFEDGETVLAHLLVIFHPFDEAESTAVEQLNKVSDLITEVASREIPRFIEHAASSSPQQGAEAEEVDGTNGSSGDEWEDDPVDPDDPSTDDDWLSGQDDPLA